MKTLLQLFDEWFYYHLFLRRIFGKKVKDVDLLELRDNLDQLAPVIFLSTGRCGTKWLNTVFSKEKSSVSLHHPIPVMRSQAKVAYSFEFAKCSDNEQLLLQEMFLGGREELFLRAEKSKKNLIFTDSRMTFFAEVIRSIFPKAKFVHLHRHPGEVVRSGLRRRWYVEENQSDLNRIEPLPHSSFHQQWEEFDSIEKNAWLWNETNRWISAFLEQVPERQKMSLSFNDWSVDTIQSLCSFCEVQISDQVIERRLNVSVNRQKSVAIPPFRDWNQEDQEKVRRLCSEMATHLNYSI